VMAARCDLNVFIQHRRDAEGIERATGESLAAIVTTYNERCRCRGERVGKLDAVAVQYEEVLVAQRGEGLGDRLRLGICKALGRPPCEGCPDPVAGLLGPVSSCGWLRLTLC